MRAYFIASLCFLQLSGVCLSATGFLYTGLIDGQWQICLYDFETESSEQLTFSTGDKRTPQYHASTDSVYFKDSQGWIACLGADGTVARVSDKGGIAEFSLIPGVDALLYTCLMANNPQRQVLWRLELNQDDAEPVLVKRMSVGSIRQIAVKSSDAFIVSHIAKRREERLYLMDDLGEGRYITPRKAISVYPTWDRVNERLLFAGELDDSTYDIFVLDLVSGEIASLLQSEGASEFATTVSDDGTTVLVEQHVHGMPSRVVSFDTTNATLTPIMLKHPAKEPFYVKH